MAALAWACGMLIYELFSIRAAIIWRLKSNNAWHTCTWPVYLCRLSSEIFQAAAINVYKGVKAMFYGTTMKQISEMEEKASTSSLNLCEKSAIERWGGGVTPPPSPPPYFLADPWILHVKTT